MSNLKPCPACGAQGLLLRHYGVSRHSRWFCSCAAGCLETRVSETKEDLVTLWNSLPRRGDLTAHEPELVMYPGQFVTMERCGDRERMRFEAAVAAMQGIISAVGLTLDHYDVAARSKRCADALLAELAKETP